MFDKNLFYFAPSPANIGKEQPTKWAAVFLLMIANQFYRFCVIVKRHTPKFISIYLHSHYHMPSSSCLFQILHSIYYCHCNAGSPWNHIDFQAANCDTVHISPQNAPDSSRLVVVLLSVEAFSPPFEVSSLGWNRGQIVSCSCPESHAS